MTAWGAQENAWKWPLPDRPLISALDLLRTSARAMPIQYAEGLGKRSCGSTLILYGRSAHAAVGKTPTIKCEGTSCARVL